jgi:hypothetical protein
VGFAPDAARAHPAGVAGTLRRGRPLLDIAKFAVPPARPAKLREWLAQRLSGLQGAAEAGVPLHPARRATGEPEGDPAGKVCARLLAFGAVF